jgi:hypothetical protein
MYKYDLTCYYFMYEFDLTCYYFMYKYDLTCYFFVSKYDLTSETWREGETVRERPHDAFLAILLSGSTIFWKLFSILENYAFLAIFCDKQWT